MRVLAAVLLVLVLPSTASAKAWTQTASSGAVKATITWKSDAHGQLIRDYRVRIVRSGATLVDGPVTIGEGENGPLAPGDWRDGLAVAVRDLELDGEPEVLIRVYTGGAHCCNTTKLWWFDGAGYQSVEHLWGNSLGYRLGATLLVGYDDFSYVFASNAGSVHPVKVLDARLRDVTKEHPRIVERDLRRLRRIYARFPDRAGLAAYVADLHSLGRHASADRLLERELRRGRLDKRSRYDTPPYGGAYINALNELLRERGYFAASAHAW